MAKSQRPFIYSEVPRNKGFPAISPFRTEVPVAGFLVFLRLQSVYSYTIPLASVYIYTIRKGNVHLYTIDRVSV